MQDLQRHTLLLFKGDYEKLQKMYPEFGAAIVVRRLVREFLEKSDKQDRVAVAGLELT